MLALRDSWVWDFWFADDGETHHLFFLYASRALHDPERRHYRAQVGHAVSDDLVTWTRIEDALVRADPGAWDDLATWTGSTVRGDDGLWYLFYTGSTLAADGANVQRIGAAVSKDLLRFERLGEDPLLAADPARHEVLADGTWHDEAFRDPWVLRDPDGEGWHMLVTARARDGAVDDRGVLAHATSPDLRTWTHADPLTAPGEGFAQLEVPQVEEVEGRWFLVFSCLDVDTSAAMQTTGATGGVWAAPADGPLGPFHLDRVHALTDRSLYSGRLVRDREGDWQLMAFHHDGEDGGFVGTISDPMPVTVREGRLVVVPPTAG